MTKVPLSPQQSKQTIQVPAAVERTKLRGRPTKDQAGTIEADILKAAIALFDELGFDGAAMEAIAARAGISKRTLYMRYSDKKAILKDVITFIVGSARQPDPPAFPNMRACLTFHVENCFMICDDPGMRVLMAMSGKPSPAVRELSSLGQEITMDLGVRHIVQTIVDTSAKFGITVHEPAFYATSLLDLTMAHHQRYRELGERVASPGVAAARIVNLLLAGMQSDCAASDR
ncbi:AcrR family transcriptional regulator [Duganella sp. SG902]|uniref:TetR/AcrR family transcriptional regulator n=1 Tax=Duganella sp. SG902 TaxID=2587016 RepID=UPI00159D511C|nr:TetR/AcrR family transcriptional regulator [Duganella sp. SG902]NVM77495.1 AcrR family transcriptional regulator [Duganella sp. SG902]